MKMCNALSSNNDVTLLTRGKKNSESDFSYYGVNKTFKIKKFNFLNIRILSSLFFSFFSFFQIIKIKPQIIFTRNRFSLLVCLLFKKNKIIFEDHSPPTGFYRYLINYMLKKKLTKIVLISNELKKIYSKSCPNIDHCNVIVAHDGADPMKIKDIESQIINFKNNKINCGYIGHLYKGRGINTIINLSNEIRDISFHIVGGNESDINYWKSKTKNNNIFFHGYFENKFIPPLINQFDILLAPYQEKVFLQNNLNTVKWMSPLKIFEYMSSGKPIISSNLLVLREVLVNEKNAFLVEPGNIIEWSEAIHRLKKDKALRLKIGNQAKRDFLSKYTWAKRAQLIIES